MTRSSKSFEKRSEFPRRRLHGPHLLVHNGGDAFEGQSLRVSGGDTYRDLQKRSKLKVKPANCYHT